MTYFPAVFVTALYGRFGPTLVAVALCDLAAAQFCIPPADALLPESGVDWTGLALFSGFGMAVGWLGEQTHRKSDQIRQERERFIVTLSSIGDGVIVTDDKARVTFLNAVAERLTGWSLADAQAMPLATVFQVVNELTRQPVENPVDQALRKDRTIGLASYAILIAKDGTERAIDDSAGPIRERNGAIIGVVLVFRDVSQQRESQRAAGRLASLVDSSEDAIIGQNCQGLITDWNTGAERLFGYSAAEIVGAWQSP